VSLAAAAASRREPAVTVHPAVAPRAGPTRPAPAPPAARPAAPAAPPPAALATLTAERDELAAALEAARSENASLQAEYGARWVGVSSDSVHITQLGAEVVCISPYYNVNRRGQADYLAADGIRYSGRTVVTRVAGERIEMGVHEGVVGGVRVFFLHNALIFPRPYPPHDAYAQMRVMCAFARGALEVLCQWRLIPSLFVTNDWFTGLASAFARNPPSIVAMVETCKGNKLPNNISPNIISSPSPSPRPRPPHMGEVAAGDDSASMATEVALERCVCFEFAINVSSMSPHYVYWPALCSC
jgi:hypothetical protein